MIHGSIMITLPPGVVSLNAAWLYHSSSGLPWALRGARKGGARQRQVASEISAASFSPAEFFPFLDPNMVFQGGRRRFSVSRESPTMQRNIEGRRRADEHQGQGLHRRHLRASDAARQGHLAGPDPRPGGQGRARGCRPQQGRCRRLLLRRRRAGPGADVDGRVHGAEAAPRRCDRHRRRVLRAACRPRRRGDRGGQVQGGADHACRPAARRRHGDRHGAAQPRRHTDAGRAVRVPLWADGGEHVRHVRDAPHARVRHHRRAACLDQGRGLAPCPVQPACAAEGRGHGRGGGELADDLRSAAPARLLRHHRRRRRDRRGGARDRGQAQAAEGQADRRVASS